MCWSSSATIALSPTVKCTRVPDAIEHAAGDAADAECRHVVEPVGLALEDRLGRQQSAAHRWADALAEIAGGEPGGISGDEGVIALHDLDAAAQVVAVTGRVVLRPRREATFEQCRQIRPVLANILPPAFHALGNRTDADVQPAVLLRHVPRVPRQPLLAEPQMTVRILPVVLDLMLERDELQLARAWIELAEQLAIHRAARPPGSNQIAAAVSVVDGETTARLGRDVAHVVLLDRRPRALEQPGVELEAPDGMLHARDRQVPAPVVHAQPREGQQPVRVGAQLDLEIAYHLRRDPAGTQLQSWKALAIEHQNVDARPPQLPGGGRAGGAAADDQHIAAAHRPLTDDTGTRGSTGCRYSRPGRIPPGTAAVYRW